MTKLNQIVAIEKTVKSAAEKQLTEAYHSLSKVDTFFGLTKTYQPKNEEGEKLPAESKKVQASIPVMIAEVRAPVVRMYDVVATKEKANTAAMADIVVDGKEIVKDAPITYLLFLEKRLQELHTFVSKMPLLPADKEWSLDPGTGLYKTPARDTHRTKKVESHIVVVQATVEHPAQTARVTEDVLAGYWTSIDFSGCISAVDQKKILGKIATLREAVKQAREQANSVTVTDVKCGDKIFDFIFG